MRKVRQVLAAGLGVTGFGLVAVGGWMVAPFIGVILAGAGCLVIAIVLDLGDQ